MSYEMAGYNIFIKDNTKINYYIIIKYSYFYTLLLYNNEHFRKKIFIKINRYSIYS